MLGQKRKKYYCRGFYNKIKQENNMKITPINTVSIRKNAPHDSRLHSNNTDMTNNATNLGLMPVKSDMVSFGGGYPINQELSSVFSALCSETKKSNGSSRVVMISSSPEQADKDLKSWQDIRKIMINDFWLFEDKNIKGSLLIHGGAFGNANIVNLSDTPLMAKHWINIFPKKHKRGDSLSMTSFDETVFHQRFNSKFGSFGRELYEGNKQLKKDILSKVELHEYSEAFNKGITADVKDKTIEKPSNISGRSATADKPNKSSETKVVKENQIRSAKQIKTTFGDIGGLDDVIKKLEETVLFPIKYPEAFDVKSHGVILMGPPGTGKSLIAEALSNEADAHYIKMNGSECESKWAGETEKNWRKVFDEAVEKQPSIVFIDEFDSTARVRTSDDNSRNDDKTVNQILTILSDIEKNGDNVFVIGATNKIDMLDPAIKRSGRFGVHIEVPLPSEDGCKKILKIHTKNKKISSDFNTEDFAGELFKKKCSGADIASIVEQAGKNCYERTGIFDKMRNSTFKMTDLDEAVLTKEDFDSALETITKPEISEHKKSVCGFKA